MLKKFLIQPFLVGNGKKSLAMILPSEVVKLLRIDPLSIFLLLKVKGTNELQLKIIREEYLNKEDETENMIPAEKFTRLSQQVSNSKGG
jgi:hypothetical protein